MRRSLFVKFTMPFLAYSDSSPCAVDSKANFGSIADLDLGTCDDRVAAHGLELGPDVWATAPTEQRRASDGVVPLHGSDPPRAEWADREGTTAAQPCQVNTSAASNPVDVRQQNELLARPPFALDVSLQGGSVHGGVRRVWALQSERRPRWPGALTQSPEHGAQLFVVRSCSGVASRWGRVPVQLPGDG